MDYDARFIVRVGVVGLHLLILKYVYICLSHFHDSSWYFVIAEIMV